MAKIVSASIKENAGQLLFVADMAGTLLFGLEGALAGIRGNLDLIGVMVLAFATALGGGIIRDLLIGAIPPASLRDWRYAALAFGGGTIAFFLYNVVQGIPGNLMMVLDAAWTGVVCDRGNREGAGAQDERVYRSVDGNDYRSRRRRGARRITGAGAACFARRGVCDSGDRGIGVHGELPKIEGIANGVGNSRRNGVLFAARG